MTHPTDLCRPVNRSRGRVENARCASPCASACKMRRDRKTALSYSSKSILRLLRLTLSDSFVRMFRALVIFALVVHSVACNTEPAPESKSGDSLVLGASVCEIARVGDVLITWSDVERMRQEYVPAPSQKESLALTVDIFTAEWMEHGTIGAMSSRDAVANYRSVVARLLRERGEGENYIVGRFLRAREKMGLQVAAGVGSCSHR